LACCAPARESALKTAATVQLEKPSIAMSEKAKRIVFCLSHTNKIPQRDRQILELLQADCTVILACWNRFPDLSEQIGNCQPLLLDYDRSPRGLLTFYRKVMQLTSRNQCHCLFTFNPICLPPLLMARKRKKIPLIFDYMEFPTCTAAERINHRFPFFDIETIHAFLNFFYSHILKSADGFLAVDSRDNLLIQRLKKLNANTQFVGNYPSLSHPFASEQKEYFKEKLKNNIVLAYAGGIFAQKGLYRYFEIIKALKSEYPNILLLLIGIFRYEHQQFFEEYLSENQLNQHVEFIPWVPFAELLAILESCHLGLALFDSQDYKFRDIHIGNSRKIFTYMLAGLPIVVSHQSLGDFVETQKIGKSVRYDDLELILCRIRALIDDQDGSKKMGLRGKKLVLDRYNWEKEKQKVTEVFSRAMDQCQK
jgi:glycosyltransferase involved in cell wall biosynthesis